VLGDHVQQRGSLVDHEKTRFDFAHDAPVSVQEIAEVERIVNAQVLENKAVAAQLMSYDDAVQGGAVALFGEKYGDEVRVLDIGFSRELCGGTHVSRTGDIGLFKVVSEGGVAAGVRRIEAITGDNSVNWAQQTQATLQNAAAQLKTQPAELVQRISMLQGQLKAAEAEVQRLHQKMASSAGSDLLSQAIELNGGSRLLVGQLAGVEAKALRGMVDDMKQRLKSGIVVLATVDGDKISLVAGVTNDLTAKVKAGELVGWVAGRVGGKGGGRPDMAMGGGSEVQALPQALESVESWVRERMA
jgi:alanyl-tRNA synthetase